MCKGTAKVIERQHADDPYPPDCSDACSEKGIGAFAN